MGGEWRGPACSLLIGEGVGGGKAREMRMRSVPGESEPRCSGAAVRVLTVSVQVADALLRCSSVLSSGRARRVEGQPSRRGCRDGGDAAS